MFPKNFYKDLKINKYNTKIQYEEFNIITNANQDWNNTLYSIANLSQTNTFISFYFFFNISLKYA